MDKYIQSIPNLWENTSWGIALYSLIVIVIAFLLTGVIGYEREKNGYSAGLRTHILVGLGSCVFTIISKYAFSDGGGDPERIAAQVVTGIGFIGAGTIIQNGISVKGLTTAATLWIVAAIGMCCGSGVISVGILCTIASILVLTILKVLEERHANRKTIRIAYIVPKDELSLSAAVKALDEIGVVIKDVDLGTVVQNGQKCTRVILALKHKGNGKSTVEVMDALNNAVSPIKVEELH